MMKSKLIIFLCMMLLIGGFAGCDLAQDAIEDITLPGETTTAAEMTTTQATTTRTTTTQATTTQATTTAQQTTAVEEEPSFDYGEFVDHEGNSYRTIVIGGQEWTVDNLRVTTFVDGSSIATGLTDDEWASADYAAYAVYPHDEHREIGSEQEMIEVFGLLYNGYAASQENNFAGEGWRVPTDEDWKILEGYVDSQYDFGDEVWNEEGFRGNDAALHLKAQVLWPAREEGLDTFGFRAIPAGLRALNGGYVFLSSHAYFWTSDEEGIRFEGDVWSRGMYVYEEVARHQDPKTAGYSIRLVRDVD